MVFFVLKKEFQLDNICSKENLVAYEEILKLILGRDIFKYSLKIKGEKGVIKISFNSKERRGIVILSPCKIPPKNRGFYIISSLTYLPLEGS